MRDFTIQITRDHLRLKINKLLKKKVAEENPLLVEFFVNSIASITGNKVKQFELASINTLDKEYLPVGNTVKLKIEKVSNWSTRDSIKLMTEEPEKYGIDTEESTINGIIVECYYYGEYYDYCIAHPYLSKDGKFTETLVDVRHDDLILQQ